MCQVLIFRQEDFWHRLAPSGGLGVGLYLTLCCSVFTWTLRPNPLLYTTHSSGSSGTVTKKHHMARAALSHIQPPFFATLSCITVPLATKAFPEVYRQPPLLNAELFVQTESLNAIVPPASHPCTCVTRGSYSFNKIYELLCYYLYVIRTSYFVLDTKCTFFPHQKTQHPVIVARRYMF